MSKRVRAKAGSANEQQEEEDWEAGYPLERKYANTVESTVARKLAFLSPAPRAHYDVVRASAERIAAYLAWVLAPVAGDREEVGAGENDPIVEACYHLIAVAEECAGLDPQSPVPEDGEDF